jgi:hypothetical protein
MKTKGWFFSFWEQWSAIFSRRCNWYDFTLIKIQGEYAPYSGRYELELGFLGFHVCIQYVYDDTFNKEMQQLADDIESGKTETFTP